MAERTRGEHHVGGDDSGLWAAFGVAFGGDGRLNIDEIMRLMTC